MHISIIGTTITQFGELWDKSLADLVAEAALGAVADAGFDPHSKKDTAEIEAIFIANKAAGNFENQHHLNALVSQLFPHFPPAMRIEGACASGSLAMIAAEHALLSGQYQTVLVVGVEKMSDLSAEETTQILAGAADSEGEMGSTFPALYAILAKQHMLKFGTQREHLSAVAVKNHLHALENAHAQFCKKLSIEQVSQSQLIADPLRVLDCSPISDGAAAVVLTTKEVGAKRKAGVWGFGHAQDSLDLAGRESLTGFAATARAAAAARAHPLSTHGHSTTPLSPTDIQVAEVHDCFTIAEIFAIEDLGFFPKGQGGLATFDNQTTYGGKIVINPSGGLKACGHPVGATGVKQVAYIAELIHQEKFELGLAHNVGGSGATAVVHILEK